MTELALDTKFGPGPAEYLTMARNSADSLLSVINYVLDCQRLKRACSI